MVERIAVAADEGRAALEQRLTDRVAQIRADLQADETSVAQEIVTRNGGAIEFQSEPGRTVFAIQLPLETRESAT